MMCSVENIIMRSVWTGVLLLLLRLSTFAGEKFLILCITVHAQCVCLCVCGGGVICVKCECVYLVSVFCYIIEKL